MNEKDNSEPSTSDQKPALEAPVGSSEPVANDDDLKIVTDFFRDLEKTMKTVNLFGLDHRNTSLTLAKLERLLGDFLERNHELTVSVRAFELTWNEQSVYQNFEIDQSLAFKLFQDGLRTLSLMRGITQSEIINLIKILAIDFRDEKYRDDDLVTMFWRSDLRNVLFEVIESFADDQSSNELQYERIVETIRSDSVILSDVSRKGSPKKEVASINYDNIPIDEQQASSIFEALETPNLEEQSVFSLTDEERQEIVAMKSRGKVILVPKVIHAFVYYIVERGGHPGIDAYIGFILTDYLIANNLKDAINLILLVHQFIKLYQPDKRKPLIEQYLKLTRQFFSPDNLERLKLIFENPEIDNELKSKFVSLLVSNPDNTADILGLVAHVADQKLRRDIASILSSHIDRKPDILKPFLGNKISLRITVEILQFLAKMEFDRAKPYLLALLKHQRKEIRRECCKIFLLKTPVAGFHELIDLLEDPEAEIRIILLRYMKENKIFQHQSVLVRKIRGKEFDKCPINEKELVIELLKDLAEVRPILVGILGERSMINLNANIDIRLLIAGALASSNRPEDSKIIRQIATRAIENKELKELCAKLMLKIGKS